MFTKGYPRFRTSSGSRSNFSFKQKEEKVDKWLFWNIHFFFKRGIARTIVTLKCTKFRKNTFDVYLPNTSNLAIVECSPGFSGTSF